MTIRRNHLRDLAGILVFLPGLWLGGCGAGRSAAGDGGGTGPVASVAFRGKVVSGTEAIAGSSIQMYAAGSSGDGSAATALLATPVMTDASGAFAITNTSYTCASASMQVYLVATGGGGTHLSSGATNSSLAMMTALGNCGDISTSTNVVINEVTTVAAVWSLAPFMKSFNKIGSSATNQAGLAHAFETAALLADVSTGASPSSSLPASLTVESGKLYSLANVLASCVDSNGGTPCTDLFVMATPSAQIQPVNTIDAAWLIVKNPGNNVNALFQSAAASPSYAGLTASPADWTMSITTQGGGLNRPATVAVDSEGKPWVANYPGIVTSLSPMGMPIFPDGLSGSGLSADYGLAIDASDNVWVNNRDANTVTKLSNGGSPLSGANGFSGGGISFPVAAAGDPSGKMWIANNGNSSVTQLSKDGVPAASSGYTGGGVLAFPSAIALDAGSSPWIANMGGSVTHLSASGTLLQHIVCCSTPTGIALDQSGNVWVVDYLDSSVIRISSSTGQVVGTSHAVGGLFYPNQLAVDGNGNIWVVNYGAGTFSVLAGAGTPSSIGTALSPAGGYGADADMSLPYGIAVDASGNLWISSFANDRVVRFIGVAAPAKTPILGLPQIP